MQTNPIVTQSLTDSKNSSTLNFAEKRKAILTAPDEIWELVLETHLPGADPQMWQADRPPLTLKPNPRPARSEPPAASEMPAGEPTAAPQAVATAPQMYCIIQWLNN